MAQRYYCYGRRTALVVDNHTHGTKAGEWVVFVSSLGEGRGGVKVTLDVFETEAAARRASEAMRALAGDEVPADTHESRATGRKKVLVGLSNAQMRRIDASYMNHIEDQGGDEADALIGKKIVKATLELVGHAGTSEKVVRDL